MSKATKKSLGPNGDGSFLYYVWDGHDGSLSHVFRTSQRGVTLCGLKLNCWNGGFLAETRDKCPDCERLVPGVVAKELARRKTAWARWITSKRRERMIVRIMKLVEKADQSALEAAIHELKQTTEGST